MSRVRLYAAAVAFAAALLLARVAFAPEPPPPPLLAVPAAPAFPGTTPEGPPVAPPPDDPFAASYDGTPPPTPAALPTEGRPGTSSGASSGAAPAPPAAPPGSPSPVARGQARPPTLAEVRDALTRLDAYRGAAFAEPADGDPDAWAARTCACHRDDTERLRDLARDGLALRGHGVTVESVAFAAPPTATHAELLVTDRATAYAVVDAAGRTVSRWPASGPRRWRVTLVDAGGRWLIGRLARVP